MEFRFALRKFKQIREALSYLRKSLDAKIEGLRLGGAFPIDLLVLHHSCDGGFGKKSDDRSATTIYKSIAYACERLMKASSSGEESEDIWRHLDGEILP